MLIVDVRGILRNINSVRRKKGFSLEYVAFKLNITISAYRKVEQNQTRLTVERLIQLSKILEIPLVGLITP